jgi:hypothetical protein
VRVETYFLSSLPALATQPEETDALNKIIYLLLPYSRGEGPTAGRTGVRLLASNLARDISEEYQIMWQFDLTQTPNCGIIYI